MNADPKLKDTPVVDGSAPDTSKSSPNTTAEVLAAVAAASINIQLGLIFAYSAILDPELVKPDSSIPVTKTDISWIASVIFLWGPIGNFVGGFCMEWMGRMYTLQLATVPYVLGWLVIALSRNVVHLIIGRSLSSLALSIGNTASFVYIAEVARPRLRGSLMSLVSLFISMGMLVVYLQGFLIQDWRTTAWLCLGYGLVPSVAIFAWCTPSPLWLVTHGRLQEAQASVRFLLRMDKEADKLAAAKIKELVAEKQNRELSNDTRSYAKKFFDTVRKPETYKPFWIIIVLFFLQQFTGLYIILLFAVRIFQGMGTKLNPYISTIWLGVLRLVMGLLTTYALRTYDRRKLCMFSGTVMAICMGLSGYCVHTGLHLQEGIFLKWVPVLCILLFISAATPGLMTLPWMISVEMFPHEVRAIIQGPVMAWANIMMFAAIKSYPSMDDFFGGVYRVHWFFATMSLGSVVFVWLFLPETHNRKLVEIERYFRNNTCYVTRTEEADRKSRLGSCGVENRGFVHNK